MMTLGNRFCIDGVLIGTFDLRPVDYEFCLSDPLSLIITGYTYHRTLNLIELVDCAAIK
ncbi:MAG: hypothetical protein RBG13Loki_0533 [Promethearchaeota archaeon CR_4]|nr:MAG: hypothetical protein RBG13Loki_0533 [Candidatus Lokiarchaeota archaeon CR_4]